ncbi:MAG: TonB-dependent receptor plug domain-containing protein [Nibricoccus sp.]
MKRPVARVGALSVTSALCLAFSPYLAAQTVPAAPAASTDNSESEEQTIVLSPFVVSSTDSQDGYQVKDTLGGTRVRTNMADVASSLQVIPKKLMDDVGITNAQGLLTYTTNTEVAGLNGNFSGVSSRGSGVQGNAEMGRITNPNGSNRARGLAAMDNTRNYFLSDIPWDSYNIDRVDISRGPNSFLFGVGSPAGISNNSTYEGVFQNKGSVEVRFGSYGTHRESLDYNYVFLPKELALRIDLLNDDTKYRQDPAYNHSKRIYGALRYDPKFLSSDSNHTTIKINGESGRVRSNNPRELPPLDYISGYFDGVVNKAGYDPFDYNGSVFPNGNNNLGSPPNLSPWISQNSIHYIWPGPAAAFWYDSATGALVGSRTTLNGGNGTSSKPLPANYLSSLPQTMAPVHHRFQRSRPGGQQSGSHQVSGRG